MKQATTILRISREAKIRIQGEERLKRQELSANTKKSMISKSAAGETDREREIRLAKERKVAAANGGEVAEETNQELTEMPRVGDKVILKTSGLAGKVTKVSDEIVTVAAGFIVAEAKLNELEKSSSSTSSVKTSSTQTFAGVKKKPTSPSRAARASRSSASRRTAWSRTASSSSASSKWWTPSDTRLGYTVTCSNNFSKNPL